MILHFMVWAHLCCVNLPAPLIDLDAPAKIRTDRPMGAFIPFTVEEK